MEPFKNNLGVRAIQMLSLHLGRHIAGFDEQAFSNPLLDQLPGLELKERTRLIADAVHRVLPEDFGTRSEILNAMLHPDDLDHAGQESDEKGICGWALWPLTMVVGQHSLGEFEEALALLKEMTKRGTAEFDIRPFLAADQPRALAVITPWVHDRNRHVRRLASEGTRPRLPWGIRLQELVRDPEPTKPILEALRDDPEEYVRRSVANHLNDISKDHPRYVENIAGRWTVGADGNRKRLVRHACRTLLKQGRPETLSIFGYEPPELSKATVEVLTPKVKIGEDLAFSLELISDSTDTQLLMIDYEINFLKSNGRLSPKVFKWTRARLENSEVLSLCRCHSMRTVTTRRYYVGVHGVSVLVNGVRLEQKKFELLG